MCNRNAATGSCFSSGLIADIKLVSWRSPLNSNLPFASFSSSFFHHSFGTSCLVASQTDRGFQFIDSFKKKKLILFPSFFSSMHTWFYCHGWSSLCLLWMFFFPLRVRACQHSKALQARLLNYLCPSRIVCPLSLVTLVFSVCGATFRPLFCVWDRRWHV